MQKLIGWFNNFGKAAGIKASLEQLKKENSRVSCMDGHNGHSVGSIVLIIGFSGRMLLPDISGVLINHLQDGCVLVERAKKEKVLNILYCCLQYSSPLSLKEEA